MRALNFTPNDAEIQRLSVVVFFSLEFLRIWHAKKIDNIDDYITAYIYTQNYTQKCTQNIYFVSIFTSCLTV